MHNKGNAWKERHRRGPRARAGGAAAEVAVDAANPVSMAKATLEQQLAEFPARLTEFRDYLDRISGSFATAGDVEAAAAEVDEAHREALAQVAEAERLRVSAERQRRAAEERAATAERERAEADAAAEEALADLERTRADFLGPTKSPTGGLQRYHG